MINTKDTCISGVVPNLGFKRFQTWSFICESTVLDSKFYPNPNNINRIYFFCKEIIKENWGSVSDKQCRADLKPKSGRCRIFSTIPTGIENLIQPNYIGRIMNKHNSIYREEKVVMIYPKKDAERNVFNYHDQHKIIARMTFRINPSRWENFKIMAKFNKEKIAPTKRAVGAAMTTRKGSVYFVGLITGQKSYPQKK